MPQFKPNLREWKTFAAKLQSAGWADGFRQIQNKPEIFWTDKGRTRLSLLNQGLMAKGLTSQNKAIEWISDQLASGFFPPGNDPVAEHWLACFEELDIVERNHALLLVWLAVDSARQRQREREPS